MKQEKKIDLNHVDPEEKIKYEIAEELGLLDKVLEQGWRSLSSKETGRIGGLVARKKRSEAVGIAAQEANSTKNS